MSAPVSRIRKLVGTDEPVDEPRRLVAGPLSLTLSDGNIRDIRWRGHEALRAISYLVRNENWGTYAPTFADVVIDERADRFHVTYRARCTAQGGAILDFDASIDGGADGRLVFDVTATPTGDFVTNRCGFCILHPIVGVAGRPIEVEHTDGSVERSVFPVAIDPAQPFLDIRCITHSVAPGVTAACRMEGDAFEMEDQRNWTDASYKTYVRPLALPWPYTLRHGEAVRQTITLTLSGEPATPAASAGSEITVSLGEIIGLAPRIGLVVTPEETEATLRQADRLADASPRCMILSFDPLRGHGLAELRQFASLASRFDAAVTLEFVLPCQETPRQELDHLARLVRQAGLSLDAIAVSPSPDLKSTPPGNAWPDCPPLEDVYEAARAAFPSLTLGGGMFSYFTELNRKRPPAGMLDFVMHTTAPIVHAADDASVMETLEALPFVTSSVRSLFGDKPYRIGPSTIGMRHNPYGAALVSNPGAVRRMTMTAEDPRQTALFAAAWMVGYAAAVADAKLEQLVLGATTGPFGLLDDVIVRPAYHAFQALAATSGQPLRAAISSDPRRLLAYSVGERLIVANLAAETIVVNLPEHQSVRVLDEDAFEHAASGVLRKRPATRKLTLTAYGIAVVDLGSRS